MTDIVYNKNGVPFDIDALVTDVNGKADTDLTNCSVPVVVSRTPNNQGGVVEIWSDGYCIQTGVVIRSTQDIAIILDQSYNDTNYIITALSTNNSGVSGSMTMIDSSGTKTVSGFILITNFYGAVPTANIQTMWRTEGYIR